MLITSTSCILNSFHMAYTSIFAACVSESCPLCIIVKFLMEMLGPLTSRQEGVLHSLADALSLAIVYYSLRFLLPGLHFGPLPVICFAF
jgi:hypothetical protein